MADGQSSTPPHAQPGEGASNGKADGKGADGKGVEGKGIDGRGADSGEDDSSSRSFLTRLFQWGPDSARETEEHLRAELGPAFSDTTPAEMAMVMNILRMRERRVEDVMTPRADIVAVAEDAPISDVIAAFEQGSLSRLPVYRETLDDPMGFIHLKDIALALGVGTAQAARKFKLSDHIRKALFVPPSMRIASLLQRMQAARIHMALVIDEFGGVDGLVTIEDLVEQIVGDIEDEHDSAEADQWSEEAPGTFVINARADIREFERAEGIHLLLQEWEEDVDTFGGLVFMLTGRVPLRGEVIAHPGGYEFEIIDADPRRIQRLRLRLNGRAEGETLSEAAE